MGWLEVLALLKRLGPALARVVPMLEVFAASRGGSRADAEALDRLAGELASVAKSHAAFAESLAGQAGQVAALSGDLRHMRDADERSAARLLEGETQVASLGKAVHQQRQMALAILLVCLAVLALLLILLFRR